MIKEETFTVGVYDKDGVYYFHYRDDIYFGFVTNWDVVFYKYEEGIFKKVKI